MTTATTMKRETPRTRWRPRSRRRRPSPRTSLGRRKSRRLSLHPTRKPRRNLGTRKLLPRRKRKRLRHPKKIPRRGKPVLSRRVPRRRPKINAQLPFIVNSSHLHHDYFKSFRLGINVTNDYYWIILLFSFVYFAETK